MEEKRDVEFERNVLTRKLESGEDVVIQTDRAAVLRNVTYPKAKYHFIVLPKEQIENVTALTRDHLPLLDHMMELANQTIEQQNCLPSSKFLVGFKMEQFMNRLNMHVISNDFCSDTMRRIQHWNTFNTDLFITFQAVYALLKTQGSVDPLSPEKAEELRMSRPVCCNQCTFKTGNFLKFKEHLDIHWQRGEKERLKISQLKQKFGNMNMNGKSKNYGTGKNQGPRPQAPKQMVEKKREEQGHGISPVGPNLTNPNAL